MHFPLVVKASATRLNPPNLDDSNLPKLMELEFCFDFPLDHCAWAHCIQRIDVEQLHFAHASISMTFRNGRCKGESVQTLTNKLLSGETQVEDIPALVGVQDPHGKVFIVSGNRRLFALKAFADQLPKEGAQCVKASTLLVSLSDMHLFPQSLFARCVEAFTSHDGGRGSRTSTGAVNGAASRGAESGAISAERHHFKELGAEGP